MKTFDLTVSRMIHGSADEVFDVWLDPKSPGGLWYGVERAIINPVVDGLFYHVVKHEGRSWPHYGRFIRLESRPRDRAYVGLGSHARPGNGRDGNARAARWWNRGHASSHQCA